MPIPHPSTDIKNIYKNSNGPTMRTPKYLETLRTSTTLVAQASCTTQLYLASAWVRTCIKLNSTLCTLLRPHGLSKFQRSIAAASTACNLHRPATHHLLWHAGIATLMHTQSCTFASPVITGKRAWDVRSPVVPTYRAVSPERLPTAGSSPPSSSLLAAPAARQPRQPPNMCAWANSWTIHPNTFLDVPDALDVSAWGQCLPKDRCQLAPSSTFMSGRPQQSFLGFAFRNISGKLLGWARRRSARQVSANTEHTG